MTPESPCSLLTRLVEQYDRRNEADDEIARLTAALLPAFRDGATVTVKTGFSYDNTYFDLTRVGPALVVAPHPVVHAQDLSWPEEVPAAGERNGHGYPQLAAINGECA